MTTGVSWKAEYTRLAHEIQVRHYSPKTLKTYTQWVRHYQTFTRSQDSKLLSSDHVKAFLTFLAVNPKVSASTRNQAFNALLLFYRHVLSKDFGKVEGGVVKLLYGCRLRLFECLQMRVQCFNFDAEILTVHDGKGQKDRTVPRTEINRHPWHGTCDQVP